jgi:hypothetical protein
LHRTRSRDCVDGAKSGFQWQTTRSRTAITAAAEEKIAEDAPETLALLVPLAITVIGTVGKFGDTPNSMVPAFALVVANRNASSPRAFLILHSFSLRSGRMSVGV